MARLDQLASRYASAILDAAGDGKKARAVLEELRGVLNLANQCKDLGRLFFTELFVESDRSKVIEDLAERAKLSSVTRKTLLVLSEVRRLSQLDLITEQLELALLRTADVIPLKVESPTDLPTADRTKVEKKFQSILGKKVEARYFLEPVLLGGLRVTAGGRTYDGSVRGWLTGFEENFAEGSL